MRAICKKFLQLWAILALILEESSGKMEQDEKISRFNRVRFYSYFVRSGKVDRRDFQRASEDVIDLFGLF